jgi:hypothetical protein
LFAGVAVSDLERAVSWFNRFIGEAESFEPNHTERVRTVSEHRFGYAELQHKHAGHAMVTLFVDDSDGFVDAVAQRGIKPETRESYGTGYEGDVSRPGGQRGHLALPQSGAPSRHRDRHVPGRQPCYRARKPRPIEIVSLERFRSWHGAAALPFAAPALGSLVKITNAVVRAWVAEMLAAESGPGLPPRATRPWEPTILGWCCTWLKAASEL